ncbi:MAG: substrate-binding domain-containing protein [Treponema sp.]|jgi:L-arabinose transport system substrate-binding protein|nr:substrate-binding domain-containing protein [Treponema sp.]
MKKLLAVMLVALTVTSMVFAGGEGDSKGGKGPLVAFICKDLSQEWFVGTSGAMKAAATARGASDVLMFDCAMNPDKYMTALDTVISRKVDVLIVCPPDQNLSQITVDRCKAAGIKVFADDDPLIDGSGKLIAPALALDAYKVGEGIGVYLAEYYAKNNMAANAATTGFMLMNMPEVSSCVPRSLGAKDFFLKGVPAFDAKKLIVADYDGTSEKGFNVASATITANPAITHWIVMAPNDEGAQGATRALEQAGKDKNAIVAGVGGYLAKDEFKKAYSCFKATAYIDPVLDGTLAGNAAMDWILNGKEAYTDNKKTATPDQIAQFGTAYGFYPFSATMIDASNYKEIMGASAN